MANPKVVLVTGASSSAFEAGTRRGFNLDREGF